MAIMPFKVIRGHRYWYQLKAHIGLPIIIISGAAYRKRCKIGGKTTIDH